MITAAGLAAFFRHFLTWLKSRLLLHHITTTTFSLSLLLLGTFFSIAIRERILSPPHLRSTDIRYFSTSFKSPTKKKPPRPQVSE